MFDFHTGAPIFYYPREMEAAEDEESKFPQLGNSVSYLLTDFASNIFQLNFSTEFSPVV